MNHFDQRKLKDLIKPKSNSSGEQNGQVTIIGGSELFHGAPLLSLKVASRIVDMVFFSSPYPNLEDLSNLIKSKLLSFIWVPWDDIDSYIKKSDAVLIGPGMKRYKSDKKMKTNGELDNDGKLTRKVTEKLLNKFPDKRWVIDAGSLQTMDPEWIPKDAIITPNRNEFEVLFNCEPNPENVKKMAIKYKCIIVLKGPESVVVNSSESELIKGGNPGMTKGGTGDVLAGLTVALLAKNDPYLSACSASYIEKAAADQLYETVGVNYNADDLADRIPQSLLDLLR